MFGPKAKRKAVSLRKRGYSLNEISRLVGISRSTASLWLKDVQLPATARKTLNEKQALGRKRGNEVLAKRAALNLGALDVSVKEYLGRLSFHPKQVKALCALLYGCEGSKRESGKLAFINSDPELVRFFLFLFRQAFPVDEEKFRVLMHLHEYHDEERQKKFWSEITGIPVSRFLKTYQKMNGEKIIRDGYQGCVSVRYNSGYVQKELVRIYREMLAQGKKMIK